jgi:hypothetical protein
VDEYGVREKKLSEEALFDSPNLFNAVEELYMQYSCRRSLFSGYRLFLHGFRAHLSPD